MNRARYTHTVQRDKQSLPTKRIYQLSEPTRGKWRYTWWDSCGKGSREGVKTGCWFFIWVISKSLHNISYQTFHVHVKSGRLCTSVVVQHRKFNALDK